MADWKIHRRGEACAGCERPFEEGEEHFSILRLGPDSLGREDRCAACFEAAEGPDDVIFWRTQHRVRRRGLAVDFDAIERLFLALEGREEERLSELRYLLSLLLMRKKRLKLVRVRRTPASELMVMRRPRRTEELEVRVFDLSPERTSLLRTELERIFEGAGAEDLDLVGDADEGTAVAEGAEPEPADRAQG